MSNPLINALNRFLMLFGILCLMSPVSFAVTVINNDIDNSDINNMQIWISNIATTDAESLPRAINHKNWQPFRHIKSNEVSKDGSVWFKFEIKASEALIEPWLLALRLATTQRARIFTVNQATKQIWASKVLGLHYTFEDRYEQSRHLVFPIDIEPRKIYDVYLEIQTTNIILAPLMLFKQSEFKSNNTIDLIVMGVMVGSLLVMLFYNLGVFSILRDATYFHYCVYVFSALFYILFLTGIAQIYIWEDNIFVINNGAYVFASLTFLTATIFFRKFLNLPSYGGWIIWTNTIIVITWAAIIFAFIFYNNIYLASLTGLMAIITTLIGIYMSIYLALKRDRIAIIYLFSWAFLMIGTGVFILMIRGVVEYNLFTTYSQMIGMVVELVLLSYALAYRINLGREQTAAAQEEALVLAKRVSTERRRRIVAQEETLSLQRNINEKLENQVELRTKQYEEAMDQLEIANADLTKLSLTDQLSQVFNRRGFDEAIESECRRARREQQNLAMIIVDIDHFKNINDNYGHTVGDTCIKEIAKALKGVVNRSVDMVARYGGEEFVFLLPNTSLEDAQLVAEKARKIVETLEIRDEGHTLKITASFGVAAWVPETDVDFQLLIKASDAALYQAKEAGRNRVYSGSRDAVS